MSKALVIPALIVTFAQFALVGCGKVVEASPRTISGSLSLLPSPITMTTNQSVQLTALQSSDPDSNSTEDVTQQALWQSSSATDFPVANGKATCKLAGTYVVSASMLALTSSSSIKCTPPTPTPAPPTPPAPPAPPAPTPSSPASAPSPALSGITILNAPDLVRSNAPFQLSVQGTYVDQSTSDVTSKTTWKSDAVARVNQTGRIYCNTAGTTTIVATVGPYTSTVQVHCLLKSITGAPGFAEHSAKFYGPFLSWNDLKSVYGAKGDGVTDDTAALQAALIAADAQKKTLWIPDGTYVYSSTLHVTGANGISIVGNSSLTTILLWKGPANGTEISFEGSAYFRINRLSLFSVDQPAAVGIKIDSKLSGNQMYPTFDALEDLRIFGAARGIEVAMAGETTIDRVHIDHANYGVIATNWNALNLNVIDSLFTDDAVGVSNQPGAGAFNVSNCVFVRSTVSDMTMGNASAFSVRHNLSVDSRQFFNAGPLNAPAAVTLEGNVVRSMKGIPVVYGNEGTIMLIDNTFETPVDSTLPILLAANWKPTHVFSLGNKFSTATPYQAQSGSQISVTSIDEAPLVNVPASAWQVPTEVYVPQASMAPVIEVLGNTPDAIQNAVDQARSGSSEVVVHIPAGTYYQNSTLVIPDSPGLAIVGDGQDTNVLAGSMLAGPVVRTSGSYAMENLVILGSPSNPALQSLLDDQPSTTVLCDICSAVDTGTGLVVSGLDNALINTRATTLNGGVSLRGGINQAGNKQTLGRVDAFMSTSDTYRITQGGHFLISDGWHDGGQSAMQAVISSGSVVTHEGGTILTQSPTGVQANGFTGQLSMVGVSVNTMISADSTSTGTLGLIGSITGIVSTELSVAGSSLNVVHGADVLSDGTDVIPVSQAPVVPADVERTLAQARTEFVVPRQTVGIAGTLVRLHRVMTARSVVGMSFSSNGASASMATYSITAPPGSGPATTCDAGTLSLNGSWSLVAGGDGFNGLLRGGVYLANTVASEDVAGTLDTVSNMTDAGQRWSIQPAGNGLFHLINRADGNLLTRSASGCAAMGAPTGDSSQEWAVAAK